MLCLARRIMCMLGRPFGIATLDGNGILTASQRPPSAAGQGSVIMPFSSGNYPTYFESNAAGGPRSGGVIGLGTDGYVYFGDEDATTIPTIITPMDVTQGTPVLTPASGTIAQFAASFQIAMPSNWEESMVATVHAVICRMQGDNMNLTPIMESMIDFTPELTYADFYGDGTQTLYPVRTQTATGLNIPIAAGERILVLFYITGNTEAIYVSSKCGANVFIE